MSPSLRSFLEVVQEKSKAPTLGWRGALNQRKVGAAQCQNCVGGGHTTNASMGEGRTTSISGGRGTAPMYGGGGAQQ